MSSTDPTPIASTSTSDPTPVTTAPPNDATPIPIAAHAALSTVLPTTMKDYTTLRITQHTKMSLQIQFGLESLITTPSPKPLILHHLPSPNPTTSANAEPMSNPSKNRSSPLPKLISCTEILKRKFESHLLSVKRRTGDNTKDKAHGQAPAWIKQHNGLLHQWNHLTTELELGLDSAVEEGEGEGEKHKDKDDDDDDDEAVMEWLTGETTATKSTKRKKRKHVPLMIVILSANIIDDLMNDKRYTYQPPVSVHAKPKKRTRDDRDAQGTAPDIELVAGHNTTATSSATQKKNGASSAKKGATSESAGQIEGEKKKKKRVRKKKKKNTGETTGDAGQAGQDGAADQIKPVAGHDQMEVEELAGKGKEKAIAGKDKGGDDIVNESKTTPRIE